VGRPVEGFSYPFGAPRDYTPTTLRLVRAAGFRQACANLGGPLTATTDPLQVPRLMVLDWEADEFEWRVERAARG
jgi:hypothetical protein